MAGHDAHAPLALCDLIAEYRSFLPRAYWLLDPHLRRQFEKHFERADVVVKGPCGTLARECQHRLR